MNLVIDIGNTRIKVAVFEEENIVGLVISSEKKFLTDIENIYQQNPKIDFCIVSGVKDISEKWLQSLQQYFSVVQLSSSTKVPFINCYDTPKTLGTDRIALVAAATKNFPNTHSLIIDAGTCVTYDFVTRQQEYLGGAISPGLAMRYKSIHNFTAKLPLLRPEEKLNQNYIGKNTKINIHIGVTQGIVFEIDGFIEYYKSLYNDLTVILTGGDSELLSKRLKNSIFAPSNFILQGLNCILEYNKD